MSTAISRSRLSFSRKWWAHRSRSKPDSMVARTYACAPHRSHRSVADSGPAATVVVTSAPFLLQLSRLQITTRSEEAAPTPASEMYLQRLTLSATEIPQSGFLLPHDVSCDPAGRSPDALRRTLSHPAAPSGDHGAARAPRHRPRRMRVPAPPCAPPRGSARAAY